MTKEVDVVFQPEGMRVRIESGQTILEAAKLAGVDLVSTCGGKGDCGKCRVIVTERKNIGPLTKIERQVLSADEIGAGYRLACRTIVNSRIAARIPEESRTGMWTGYAAPEWEWPIRPLTAILSAELLPQHRTQRRKQ